MDQTDRYRHARVLRAQCAGGLHTERSCSAQRLWLRRDRASAFPDDQYAGDAHWLACPVHRAWHHPDPAKEARDDQRRARGKSSAAVATAEGTTAATQRRLESLGDRFDADRFAFD